ncbi:MAG TPA: 2OG-Fe(II) oxygenase [Bryobacteraceae bacterium]|nr:2OG-Fe(II) oxygenase [Bryobacteraceae bacterium]
MLDLLNPALRDRQHPLAQSFQSARPFKHVVIDDFLRADYCRELMDQFPNFTAEKARNEFGEVGRKAVFQNLPQLGPAYAQFDQMLQANDFRAFIGRITGIPDLIYDPEYIGGGTHENLNGQDLDSHVDFNYHPTRRYHRRLNLIVFLNPQWREDWGGCLELELDPALPPDENQVISVSPEANRCVIFETTERSWHGFRRIQIPPEQTGISRRSIAVYYYTKTRPRDEAAPSHGTIYIQRPLPEHIRAGHTLTASDVRSLQTLLERRDKQMAFLYERELEFSRIAQSPTFRAVRLLTWPLRKLRDLRS